MPFCRECAAEVSATMKFCPECAAPQATQSASVNIQDSAVAGDVNITQVADSAGTCESCNASNVRVMTCIEKDCSTSFCEICNPICRVEQSRGYESVLDGDESVLGGEVEKIGCWWRDPEDHHFGIVEVSASVAFRFDSGLGSGPYCSTCMEKIHIPIVEQRENILQTRRRRIHSELRWEAYDLLKAKGDEFFKTLSQSSKSRLTEQFEVVAYIEQDQVKIGFIWLNGIHFPDDLGFEINTQRQVENYLNYLNGKGDSEDFVEGRKNIPKELVVFGVGPWHHEIISTAGWPDIGNSL